MRYATCILTVLILTVGMAAPSSSAAQDRFGLVKLEGTFGAPSALVSAKAIPSHVQVQSGQSFYVAVELEIRPGYAYYSPVPGPDVLPGNMKVSAPGLMVGKVLWPPDKPHEFLGMVNNAYEGRAIVYIPITVPADAANGKYTVTAEPKGQVCGDEKCVPVENALAMANVEVGPNSVVNPDWTGQIAQGLSAAKPVELFPPFKSPLAQATGPAEYSGGVAASYGVLGGLLLALWAGVILNIMPCVLPVIPLKVLGIVQQAKESRRRFVTLGLAFAGGVVLFFVAVAAFNAVLKVLSQGAFEWGQHFQSPAFRIFMAMLMVALAANLFGAFTVLAPRRAAQMEAQASTREGHASAMAMGVLTGVLSTPCSFAILTAAFVWAQSQPLWLGTLAIVMIGVGMAAPYALLTAFPELVKRLPRPGRWMEIFKQGMGFILLLVAVWLISTGAQDTYPFWVAGFGVLLAFCLWMWGSWVRYDAPLARKVAVRTVAILLAVGAGAAMLPKPQPLAVHFEPFDQMRLQEANRQGRIVLVDFTASWCLTCKVVEARVYNDPEVAAELKKLNVLAMKGDTTTAELAANKLKKQLGEAIPVTVIFPPSGGSPERPAPIRLRGIFSKADLFNALGHITKSKS